MRAFRERFGRRDVMLSISMGSLAILVAGFATCRSAMGDGGAKAQTIPVQSADTSATWSIHTQADGSQELVVVATYPEFSGNNGLVSYETASTMLKSGSGWTRTGPTMHETATNWTLISHSPVPLAHGGTITYYFQPSKTGADNLEGTGTIRVVTLYKDGSSHPLGNFTKVDRTPPTSSKQTPVPGGNLGH